MLCKWLSGDNVMRLEPPRGPRISGADMQRYLQASSYFVAHPRNFAHMQESVDAGAKLLPQSAGDNNL